jgi:hypothetical protein
MIAIDGGPAVGPHGAHAVAVYDGIEFLLGVDHVWSTLTLYSGEHYGKAVFSGPPGSICLNEATAGLVRECIRDRKSIPWSSLLMSGPETAIWSRTLVRIRVDAGRPSVEVAVGPASVLVLPAAENSTED